MSSSKLFTLYLSLLTLLLVGCHSAPKDVTEKDQLPQIWPDYVGVTIPVGIAPLNFSMADDEVTTIDVEVRGSKGGSLHANGDYADFDIDEWHRLLEANKGGQLTLTVCAEKNGQWTRYRGFQMMVSTEPLDEWGPQTESLHNWSTGSRWFLFTSRRDDGLYTRIYFSCLDENGKATKPFLLPQHNPKQYYRRLLYSYNTPDFATRPLDLDSRDMSRRIESEERVSTK